MHHADRWDDLLPVRPYAKPPGILPMLHVIAYDIADPRRLARVANWCEDHATRVQDSLYECWLDEPEFVLFWSGLAKRMDLTADRAISYRLDASATRERQMLGQTMVCTEKVLCYIV